MLVLAIAVGTGPAKCAAAMGVGMELENRGGKHDSAIERDGSKCRDLWPCENREWIVVDWGQLGTRRSSFAYDYLLSFSTTLIR